MRLGFLLHRNSNSQIIVTIIMLNLLIKPHMGKSCFMNLNREQRSLRSVPQIVMTLTNIYSKLDILLTRMDFMQFTQ
jgi:hypothetical protein